MKSAPKAGLLARSLVRPVKKAVAQNVPNRVPRAKAKPVAAPKGQTKTAPAMPKKDPVKRGYTSKGC